MASPWCSGSIGVRGFDSPDEAAAKCFSAPPGLQIRLGLTEDRQGSQGVFDETRVGLDHLAFAVADRDELDRWATRLATLSVVHSPIAPDNSIPGASVLVLRDPDNIQLELVVDPTDPPPS